MSKNTFALWSEFTPYQDFHLYIDRLIQANVALYLAIHEENYQDKDLYTFLKDAQNKGLEIRPWPLLKKEKGYWINKWNIPAFTQFVRDFHQECLNQEIKLKWIILDIEPHFELMLELERLLQKRHYLKAYRLLKSWNHKINWNESQKDMKNLVQLIHDLGIKIHAVTMPMVLDDCRIGKQKLQSTLGLPIEGIDWDEISFMIYRPYFWDYLPHMSAEIVASYAIEAKKFFKNPSIALGPVGPLGMTQSKYFYKHPQELEEDISASVTCGITHFSLFCFEGLEKEGGFEQYLKSSTKVYKTQFNIQSFLFRKIIQFGLKFIPFQF